MLRRPATIALGLALAACSRTPAPKDPTERALFRDLERQVTVAAATGWGVDKLEIDGLLESALDSVCRVDVLGRRGVREWLDAEISRLGGPVEVAWQRNGKKLSKLGDLMRLHRVHLLLDRADELSLECPFWIEPVNPFTGRQISENRWQLSFGGGGTASALQKGSVQDVSAGGSGRLLIGRMFDEGDGLYVGADVGGSAQIPKDVNGERTSLELGVDLMAPIVYRHTLLNTYWEVEAGWLGHSTEKDWGAIDQGMHVGFAFGGRALRQRFLFPGAVLAVAYERLFLDGDDLITLKLGARVQFDWDL
ncbi:MAG TPA: hypothetical protein VIV40_27640 [Kofleriaceae bacterium]